MNDLNEFCTSEGKDIEALLKSLTTISNFQYLTSQVRSISKITTKILLNSV